MASPRPLTAKHGLALLAGVICVFLLSALPLAATRMAGGTASAAPSTTTSSFVQSLSAMLAAQQAHLVAADGAAQAWLGDTVAVSGNTAVVGARGAAPAGAAYVFVRNGTTWRQQAKLTAADGTAGDAFGSCVAVSGDTAVVGSPNATVSANQWPPGAACVFVRSGTTWSEQAKLTAADGASHDQFGSSVGVWGDTAVAGAPMHSGASLEQGATYVFVRSGTTWSQQAELTAADGAEYDSLGQSVAVSQNTVVAGAQFRKVGANTDEGAAYVFARDGTTWSQQAELTSSDGAASDLFGCSVAVCQDTTVVAAYSHQVGANTDEGAAYVFARNGTTWGQQAELTASDGAWANEFGRSVAVSGRTAVVGAPFHLVGHNDAQGAAYVFTANGTTWSQRAELTAADGIADDELGCSVAVSGGTCVAGAPRQSTGRGAAYVFTVSDSSMPYLTCAYPWYGVPAAAVTISGSHFGATQGAGTVTFGGTAAAVSSWSDTSICCSVPASLVASEADVAVTTSNGASNAQPFMVCAVIPGQPIVSSVTPPHALRGAGVMIAGSGFGATQDASTVTLGGIAATVTSWSDTAITCTLPAGLTAGTVDVIVHTTLDSNIAGFTVDSPPPKPSIAKISPTKGKVGITVTIVGKYFGAKRGTSKVLYGTKAATKYVLWSATKIKVRVPSITKGRKAIRVVTAAGKSNAKYFTRL